MAAGARVASFALLVALAFGAAALAGSEVDPGVEASPHDEKLAHVQEEDEMQTHETGTEVPGLAVAEGGLRLILDQTRVEPSAHAPISFRIVDGGGATVEDFDTEHERRMHLIVVRRDFSGFQHLHPVQQADGSWRARLDSRLPGAYRAFADFASDGASLTLGGDLFVPGAFEPVPLEKPAAIADAGDAYEVSVESGELRAGESAALRFRVSRGGRELPGVEPYLGADGHLVALREGDLGFLHTHPEGEPGGSGPIRFQVSYPSEGRYRIFLQFRHDGEVRTAAFTQVAGPHQEGER